jgi:hypothetical protein
MLFIPLVPTSFGHFGHPQANAAQNLKRLVICSVHKFQDMGSHLHQYQNLLKT